MINSPKSVRLHIGLFGRRNVGKSSLINALTNQHISIVSDVPGTTTDPVEKAMELLPFGPVVFIDTAGIDDRGELGQHRVNQTFKALQRTDVALLVSDGTWGQWEEDLLRRMQKQKLPVIVVFNKSDVCPPTEACLRTMEKAGIPVVRTNAIAAKGMQALKRLILQMAPETAFETPTIVGDLIRPGALVVLVIPIDLEAPKGRLILPQVQTIRDVLDNDAYCMMVKERELSAALARLKEPPDLVVTDSQAFLKVAADTPNDVPLTSFSILFARIKGDLRTFVDGALRIENLRAGARILIAEACTHHTLGDDIARVKIPRWLRQYAGHALNFTHVQGRDFPEDLAEYDLVIHCGACMFNRRQVLARIEQCRQAGVPVTNYGVCIAYSLGIFERALQPFPEAADLLERKFRSES
jgi:[FeFe] hydrogenase H-cluster maturation GTPase HydF